jgi:hypothetical protein
MSFFPNKTTLVSTVLGTIALVGGIILPQTKDTKKSLVGRFNIGTNLVEVVQSENQSDSVYSTYANGREILRTSAPNGAGAFVYDHQAVFFNSARGPYEVKHQEIIQNTLTNSIPLN